MSWLTWKVDVVTNMAVSQCLGMEVPRSPNMSQWCGCPEVVFAVTVLIFVFIAMLRDIKGPPKFSTFYFQIFQWTTVIPRQDQASHPEGEKAASTATPQLGAASTHDNQFSPQKNAFPADGNFGLILHQNGLRWIQHNYNTFNHCRTLEKAAVAKACERHRLIDFDAVASQLPAAARAAAVASVPRCLCCIFLSDLPVQHCMTATFDVQRHIYSRARFPISRSLREADFSGISCVQGV